MLRAQVSFLTALEFNTGRARQLFPPEFVQAKIKEAKQLLRLLQSEPSSRFSCCNRRSAPFRRVRYRRNLVVPTRSGEGPLTIRFADLRHRPCKAVEFTTYALALDIRL